MNDLPRIARSPRDGKIRKLLIIADNLTPLREIAKAAGVGITQATVSLKALEMDGVAKCERADDGFIMWMSL
jgi:hypothetical protein